MHFVDFYEGKNIFFFEKIQSMHLSFFKDYVRRMWVKRVIQRVQGKICKIRNPYILRI